MKFKPVFQPSHVWRIFLLAVFLLLCSTSNFAQEKVEEPQPSHQLSKEELGSLHQSLEDFLKSWLIRRDEPQIQSYFHSNIFLNRHLFQGSGCPEIIKERDNLQELKKAVLAYLKELGSLTKGHDLITILNSRYIKRLGFEQGQVRSGSTILNDPLQDRFIICTPVGEIPSYLSELVQHQTQPIQKDTSVRELLVYTTFRVQLWIDGEEGEGRFSFVWMKEGSDWKIIDLQEICP